ALRTPKKTGTRLESRPRFFRRSKTMADFLERIALLYDDDAFVEVPQSAQAPVGDRAMGLMGRHVAGKEFLDALLAHGRWTELVAVVRNEASIASLQHFWQSHAGAPFPGRRLSVV